MTGVIFSGGMGLLFRPSTVEHPPSPGLPGYAIVPSFTLIDQTGQAFSSTRLIGEVWIADFIFTSCAGTCPQMTEKMRFLQRRLPAGIRLVSISVDPIRDTPTVLAEYARRAGAENGRRHFLTGSPETIEKLVQQGFRLSYAEGGDPKEPITHSVRLVLVDRDGKIRRYYDSTDPKAIEQLIQEATQLVR